MLSVAIFGVALMAAAIALWFGSERFWVRCVAVVLAIWAVLVFATLLLLVPSSVTVRT